MPLGFRMMVRLLYWDAAQANGKGCYMTRGFKADLGLQHIAFQSAGATRKKPVAKQVRPRWTFTLDEDGRVDDLMAAVREPFTSEMEEYEP